MSNSLLLVDDKGSSGLNDSNNKKSEMQTITRFGG